MPSKEIKELRQSGRLEEALQMAQNELEAGIWGMIAGDGDRNGTIDSGDKSTLWDIETGSAGYINTDYNLDGQSNNIDKDEYWLPNIGRAIQVPN